jgi:hypothetical protein
MPTVSAAATTAIAFGIFMMASCLQMEDAGPAGTALSGNTGDGADGFGAARAFMKA